MKIGYFIAKAMEKITKNHEYICDFYRKLNVKIGKNCLICSNTYFSDYKLIEIKDDVVISSNVSFIAHDHSIYKVQDGKGGSNLFGKIVIGNNCFIGHGSIILYGVELADNIIVASGSVVTKSFCEPNIIIGGNPAKKIGTWEEFKIKYQKHAIYRNELETVLLSDSSKLVKK